MFDKCSLLHGKKSAIGTDAASGLRPGIWSFRRNYTLTFDPFFGIRMEVCNKEHICKQRIFARIEYDIILVQEQNQSSHFHRHIE